MDDISSSKRPWSHGSLRLYPCIYITYDFYDYDSFPFSVGDNLDYGSLVQCARSQHYRRL